MCNWNQIKVLLCLCGVNLLFISICFGSAGIIYLIDHTTVRVAFYTAAGLSLVGFFATGVYAILYYDFDPLYKIKSLTQNGLRQS